MQTRLSDNHALGQRQSSPPPKIILVQDVKEALDDLRKRKLIDDKLADMIAHTQASFLDKRARSAS